MAKRSKRDPWQLSRQWLAAIGATREELAARGKRSPMPFIVSIVALPIMAWIPAAFGHRKASLAIMDGIHWLGVLVIQSAIIGAMRV